MMTNIIAQVFFIYLNKIITNNDIIAQVFFICVIDAIQKNRNYTKKTDILKTDYSELLYQFSCDHLQKKLQNFYQKLTIVFFFLHNQLDYNHHKSYLIEFLQKLQMVLVQYIYREKFYNHIHHESIEPTFPYRNIT